MRRFVWFIPAHWGCTNNLQPFLLDPTSRCRSLSLWGCMSTSSAICLRWEVVRRTSRNLLFKQPTSVGPVVCGGAWVKYEEPQSLVIHASCFSNAMQLVRKAN